MVMVVSELSTCFDGNREDLHSFWGVWRIFRDSYLPSGYFLYDTVHVAVWDQKFMEHSELL